MKNVVNPNHVLAGSAVVIGAVFAYSKYFDWKLARAYAKLDADQKKMREDLNDLADKLS
jgi:hypothetical protein